MRCAPYEAICFAGEPAGELFCIIDGTAEVFTESCDEATGRVTKGRLVQVYNPSPTPAIGAICSYSM